MKKIRFILLGVSLILLGALSLPSVAQEKTKEEKEKEFQMQEEINQQKKEIERLKAEQESVMKDQQKMFDEELKKAEHQQQVIAEDKYKDLLKVYRNAGDRPRFEIAEPFIFTPGIEGLNWFSHGGDNERTTWDFSKSVKESSFTRDYTFDVEPTVETVVMSVNGDCKAGEIRIKIVMPNNKVYSDIMIDEFGNLNWRKSFTISEEENKDKAGAWKFQINASKATGYFKISLQTY